MIGARAVLSATALCSIAHIHRRHWVLKHFRMVVAARLRRAGIYGEDALTKAQRRKEHKEKLFACQGGLR